MYRSRISLVLFAITFTLSVLMPQPTLQASPALSAQLPSKSNITTKVLVDSEGSVHILWTVPSQNGTGTAPGIWYSKYAPNGTDSIAPVLIRNSSDVQSADMGLDKFNRPHIVWAEGPSFGNSSQRNSVSDLQSQLYYVEVNSTELRQYSPSPLTAPGRLVMWPSIAVDENLTTYLVWSQVDPNGRSPAGAYYGIVNHANMLNQTALIGAFNQSFLSPPRPRIALDDSLGLHVAWVENDQLTEGRIVSSVSYARLDFRARNITRLRVAKFNQELNDVTVAAGRNGSAYVVWQAESGSNLSSVVYILQISRNGRVIFLKQVNQPNAPVSRLSYLSIATDPEDNVYVVWYQPPLPPVGQSSKPGSAPTNVSYLKLDYGGVLSETGNQVVLGPVIAVTVSATGDLLAISSQGIVKVTNPPSNMNIQIIGIAVGTISALAAGTAVTEDGRYRLFRFLSPLAGKLSGKRSTEHAITEDSVLRVICRKPGLRYTELKRLLPNEERTMLKLALLEHAGYIASIRDGLKRRFYITSHSESVPISHLMHSVSTRILSEIAHNPGIWEARIAENLKLSQQIVHYHLKKLYAAKIIIAKTEGKRKHYNLSDPNSR